MKKYIIIILACSASNFIKAQTTEVTVTASGDMGIGVEVPENKLHIKGDENVVLQVESEGSTATASQINLNSDKISGQSWLISSSGSAASLGAKKFSIFNNSIDQTLRQHVFVINKYNKVGIGVEDPQKKLDVNGAVNATSYYANDVPFWPDYVFSKQYSLRPLTEVEDFIQEHNHLPEIPSQVEVSEYGINLGEMDAKLLQKIEELTLYMIDMNKRVNQLEMENAELKTKIKN